MYKILFLLCLLSGSIAMWAQGPKSDEYKVDEIIISGNRWTRDQVVIRELNFRQGEKYPLSFLLDKNVESKARLENLGLFNDVQLNFQLDSLTNEIDYFIDLVENWYIFPGVSLELADRNFNEWWVNQNRDLSRINYGLRVDHINLTGRRDRMVLQLQGGFREKYELVYNLPYLNYEGTWGAEAFVFFANQDQIPYKTENNRTIYAGFEERTLLERFRAGGALFYRPGIYHHHAFRLEYHKNSVDDYVIQELNSQYFLDGRNSIQFMMFNYHYTYDQRISQFYPVDGYLFWVDFKKEGFKIWDEYNNTALAIGGEFYHPITEKLVYGNRWKAKANLDRRVVSFANNTGIGWGGDQLGGYSLYVVDGTDYVYARNNVRYQFLNKRIDLGKWMLFKQFRILNIQLYGRILADVAYVNDRTYRQIYNNTFNNRWLYGAGPAIDMVLYNNYKTSFNVAVNHLGQLDYFFQYSTNF